MIGLCPSALGAVLGPLLDAPSVNHNPFTMNEIKKDEPSKVVHALPNEERNANGTFKPGNRIQSINGHSNKKRRDNERNNRILKTR